MTDKLLQIFPPEGVKIILTLFLCFLIGLEREEHRTTAQEGRRYSFGGVRAFPLIGLIGYAMALLSGAQLLPLTVGFVVIGAFLWLSYRHKLETSNTPGVTTELSGLATYVVGALVSRDQFWIATTLAILSMLLLELKEFLENLATKIPGAEIFTFTKFLLLTCVILPRCDPLCYSALTGFIMSAESTTKSVWWFDGHYAARETQPTSCFRGHLSKQ